MPCLSWAGSSTRPARIDVTQARRPRTLSTRRKHQRGNERERWAMSKGWKRFLPAIILLTTFAGCSHGARAVRKERLPETPVPRNVQVLGCRYVEGKKFCEVEIVPLLLNDEDCKDHIEKLEGFPVWIRE